MQTLVTILLALALILAAPFLVSTPAGPALVAVALLAQAEARGPAYAPAVLFVHMPDADLLASLLAREVA